MLGQSFDRLWPVEETPCFGALLQAIDDADRNIRRGRDAKRDELLEQIILPAGRAAR